MIIGRTANKPNDTLSGLQPRADRVGNIHILAQRLPQDILNDRAQIIGIHRPHLRAPAGTMMVVPGPTLAVVASNVINLITLPSPPTRKASRIAVPVPVTVRLISSSLTN